MIVISFFKSIDTISEFSKKYFMNFLTKQNRKHDCVIIICYSLIMMRKVLSSRFATATADYLSTKGLKMFGSGDYP